MQVPVGMPSPMRMTARHLAKRAPSFRYSSRRWRRPSRPSVTTSPGQPASGWLPLSTLIPARIPWSARQRANGTPALVDWRMVSSDRATPLIDPASPGAVARSSR
jgi:hypothetical protein